jgi:CDK inhibitor PHO81
VAACLLNITDTTIPLSATLREELSKHDSVLNAQLMREPLTRSRVFLDLEDSLRRAADQHDVAAVQQALVTANELTNATDGRTYVSRILWKCAVEAEPELADLILDSPVSPCDFKFIDDINGRTSIHEAAAAGAPRLIDRCIAKGVEVNKRDSYGRTALHYAVIEGHAESVDRLLAAKADPTILDLDNFSCLYYAVVFGQLECVRLLFRMNGPGLRLAPEGSDIDLLSLACLHGHYDIALLLLDQGANQVPNSNGQYPIHLAAGAGHAEICQLLSSRARETLDIPDKYNEWTPLFHAAQKGRASAVKVLVDARCDTTATDELGRTPIFYAGWYGHIDCVELLLSTSRKQKPRSRVPGPAPKQVPEHPIDELEVDTIPTLSLPPPIMPFRIYGHNYLDKQYLVQLTLGRPHSQFYLDKQSSPVKITAWESNLSTIPPNSRPQSLLKMIMTSRPDTAATPVNLTIPLSEERDVISFQVQDLSELALEFSFYPLFGSKTIGRAAVLPSAFENIKDSRTISLAILDHRLHIIGQATFEACIIRPFTGVTLQFGGAVDTYWKSSSHHIDKAIPVPITSTPSALDSTHTSPSNRSAIMNPSGSITISSLSRDQLTVVIQGTRDLVPVIYSEWTLPVDGLNIGVSDVNYEQFERIAAQVGRSFEVSSLEPVMSTRNWVDIISNKMMKLETLLTVSSVVTEIISSFLTNVLQHLPADVGLNLHVAFPNRAIRDLNFIGHCLDLNSYIESILLVIYRAASTQSRRQVSFLSFSPSVCTALNWKQPNCE